MVCHTAAVFHSKDAALKYSAHSSKVSSDGMLFQGRRYSSNEGLKQLYPLRDKVNRLIPLSYLLQIGVAQGGGREEGGNGQKNRCGRISRIPT